LTFGGIANRYLADFLPGLIVAAIAGLHLLFRWSARRRGSAVCHLTWTGLALLAALGLSINVGLAVLYARNVESYTPPAVRRDFVRFQHRVHDILYGDDRPGEKRASGPGEGAYQRRYDSSPYGGGARAARS
jgi:hypothetical protein